MHISNQHHPRKGETVKYDTYRFGPMQINDGADKRKRAPKFCDSCLDAAQDEMQLFGDGLDELEDASALGFLADIGFMLPDHLCDALEDDDILCSCSAHRD